MDKLSPFMVDALIVDEFSVLEFSVVAEKVAPRSAKMSPFTCASETLVAPVKS